MAESEFTRRALKRPYSGQNGTNAVDNYMRQVLQVMVECSYCGSMGYKHSYHLRDNLLFCGDLCAQLLHSLGPQRFKPLPTIDFKSVIGDDAEYKAALNAVGRRKTRIPKKDPPESYKWPDNKDKINAAPVECFKHAPGALFWSQYVVDGIKVEIETTENVVPMSCWVATLEKQVGYCGLFRYVGGPSKALKKGCFWMNICSPLLHPVGWSATHGRPLTPPKSIADTRSSAAWQQCLSKALQSTITLPWTFDEELNKSCESRFSAKQLVEVVDKNRLDTMKSAEIYLIGAKRLMISYYDNDYKDTGFTCHEDSELLHHVGWSEAIGHCIDAPPDYSAQWRTKSDKYARSTTKQLFKSPPVSNVTLEVGMKLEAIDPLNLSTICVATIKKVLAQNYMMIRIDRYDEDEDSSDWFCVHVTSTSIFPAGFCKSNQINIVKPREFRGNKFHWPEYLKKTKSRAAAIELQRVPNHGFKEGMQLEVVDLMKPHSVCVGTVRRVVGRLLRIHFDGWSAVYDQWMDCESPDMYPVGWCEAVKHELTAPPIPGAGGVVVNITPGKKPKTNKGRGRRSNLSEVSPKSSISTDSTPPKSTKATKAPNLKRASSPISKLLQNKEVDDKVTSVGPPMLSPAHSPAQSKLSSHLPEDHTPQNTPPAAPASVYLTGITRSSNELLPEPVASTTSEKNPTQGAKPCTNPTSKGAKQNASKVDFWYEEEHPKILKTTTRSGQLVRYSSGMIVRRESTSTRILKKASKQQNSVKSPQTPLKKKVPRRKSTGDTVVPSLKKVAPAAPAPSVPSGISPFTLFTQHHFQATDDRVIPRLIDESAYSTLWKGKLEPSKWNYREVAQFLRVNDMEQFSGSFSQRKIDGATFLNLTMSTIIHLVDQKVGPATHITNLIKVLKSKIK